MFESGLGDFMPFTDRELAYNSFIAFLDLYKGFDFLSEGGPVSIGEILICLASPILPICPCWNT